jgi:hypothetical protein
VGEPTRSPALVTWAAYPDTVLVGKAFPFEIAGPVSLNTCGRLDTTTVTVTDTAILVSGERSLYRSVFCSGERVSFYVPRSLTIGRAGRYPVRTADGRSLGVLVALDSGAFSPVRTIGEGTVRHGGGCLLFGPAWASNQRPFSVHSAPARVEAAAGTDSIIRLVGPLAGFDQCGGLGSRPVIQVDSAAVTGRVGADWYSGG